MSQAQRSRVKPERRPVDALDVVHETAMALVRDFGDIVPEGIEPNLPWAEVEPYAVNIDQRHATTVLVPSEDAGTVLVVEVIIRARSLMLEEFPAVAIVAKERRLVE